MVERIWLTPAEAAGRLSINAATLAAQRRANSGPPYVRLGRRIIRYRADELDQWVAREREKTASQVAA